jgi:hypothetical protein
MVNKLERNLFANNTYGKALRLFLAMLLLAGNALAQKDSAIAKTSTQSSITPMVITPCTVSGPTPVSMCSTAYYSIDPACGYTAASWSVTCGTIVSWDGLSVTVNWNGAGCSTGYVRAYDNTSALIGSKTVSITTSALNGGSITGGANQSIGSGTSPALITASYPTGGDCSGYTYTWQSSTDNLTFYDIAGTNSPNYQPGALTTTTYFWR